MYFLLSFLKRTYVSRNALNLNFIKLQYEDFTSCIFTFMEPRYGKKNVILQDCDIERERPSVKVKTFSI